MLQHSGANPLENAENTTQKVYTGRCECVTKTLRFWEWVCHENCVEKDAGNSQVWRVDRVWVRELACHSRDTLQHTGLFLYPFLEQIPAPKSTGNKSRRFNKHRHPPPSPPDHSPHPQFPKTSRHHLSIHTYTSIYTYISISIYTYIRAPAIHNFSKVHVFWHLYIHVLMYTYSPKNWEIILWLSTVARTGRFPTFWYW